MTKTIKISEEKYRKLLKIASDLQKEREEKVSFDDALEILMETKKNKDIMGLAGAWKKMSDEEWDGIRKSLDKRWVKWKTRSA
jgi:predicted CopG family antitoxin